MKIRGNRGFERVEGFFSEFWKFVGKGNVVDLTIGVILGTAFSQVINSIVADLVTPLLSLATNNVDFSTWSYTVREPIESVGTTTPALVLNYGHLMQVTLNFLIVGLCIFIFYKLLVNLRKRIEHTEAQEPPTPVSTQEKLLEEIRDLLKEQAGRGEEDRAV